MIKMTGVGDDATTMSQDGNKFVCICGRAYRCVPITILVKKKQHYTHVVVISRMLCAVLHMLYATQQRELLIDNRGLKSLLECRSLDSDWSQ